MCVDDEREKRRAGLRRSAGGNGRGERGEGEVERKGARDTRTKPFRGLGLRDEQPLTFAVSHGPSSTPLALRQISTAQSSFIQPVPPQTRRREVSR